MTDEPIEAPIAKVDSDGDPLTGAVWHVEGQFAGDSASSVRTLDSGDASSVTMVDLVVGRTYRVTETTAPHGQKQLSGFFEFKVNADGTLTETEVSKAATRTCGTVEITDDGHGLRVTDEATRLDILKTNEDESKSLAGAEFSLVPEAGTTFADGSTAAMEFVTDETGHHVIEGQLVVGGTYTLTETKAPEGYKLIDGGATFTVKPDGTVCGVGSVPANYRTSTTEEGGQVLKVFGGVVSDDPTRLSLSKVSSEDTLLGLAGATFTLTGRFAGEGDVSSQELITDENGFAKLDDARIVADGATTYTISEAKSPDGYALMDGTVEFVMDTDGKVRVTKAEGADADGYTVNDDGVSLTAADKPVRLSIYKDAADGPEIGKALARAEFSVVPSVDGETFADGSTELTMVTDEDGSAVEIAKLIVGHTYKVTETKAAVGYGMPRGSFEIKVNNDGTVTAVDSLDGYSVDDDGLVVNVSDPANDLRVVKRSSEDGTDAKAMTGARFLVKASEDSSFADGSTLKYLTVGEDGVALCDGKPLTAQLISGQTYEVSEARAPAGFARLDGTVTITLNEYGEISSVGEDPEGWTLDYDFDNDVMALTAADDPVIINLAKYASLPDGTRSDALSGAEFELSGDFATGDGGTEFATRAVSVTEDGLVVDEQSVDGLRDLVVGETYSLVELAAPAGYRLIDGTLRFEVNEDGTIAAVGGACDGSDHDSYDGCYELTEDSLGIDAVDAPTELRVDKVGTDGKSGLAMAGAEFLLEPAEGSAFADATGAKTLVVGTDGTTLENGKPFFGQLVAGNTYTLTETKAPAGYVLRTTPVSFEVQAVGSVTVVGGASGAAQAALRGWTIGLDGATAVVTLADEPTTMRFVKTSTEDSRLRLSGATFRVSCADRSTTFANGSRQPIEVTTDSDGLAEISGKLVAGGTYVLAEVRAPQGYETTDATWTIRVTEDGMIAKGVVRSGATGAKGSARARAYLYSIGGTYKLTVADVPTPEDSSGIPKTGDWNTTLPVGFTLAMLGLVAFSLSRRYRRDENDLPVE